MFKKEKVNSTFDKKIPRIIGLVLLDVVSVIIASFLALWMRFDFQQVPVEYLHTVIHWLPVDCLIVVIIFIIVGLYTSIWRYASVFEFITIIGSCIGSGLIIYFYKHAMFLPAPRSFWFIFPALLLFFVCGTRYSYRVSRLILHALTRKDCSKNVMIVGGGEAAWMLINEMDRNGKYRNVQVCCIIDDNKQKHGTRLHRIPVVGNRSQIQSMVEKYKIDQIIIAIPSASKEQIARIVTECQKTKCEITILPSLFLTMDEKNVSIAAQIRPIRYEDFLGRDQIIVNNAEIEGNLTGKTILVTGGGGSIGSELCRQIVKAEPKLLIIFDIYENNAYDIQQELYRNYPRLNLETIVGSVRDYPRLEKVFKEFRPEQVYHAAAHKHVPLMEVSPNEAIKNNCLGTLNTVKLADKYKVEKFVLVSTDKAVRPTNIMGASKRICEMIIQAYDRRSETNYVAVRFGNVLGSNGSVIPLFLKQIDSGGPVTVTHKDITRYFMTIPEAVSLILQASVYAEGGEIFVLDMGKPVRIYDLAKKIIRYKGLEPGKDIKIVFTGLRPGEKLYEEMLMEEEGMKETPNKLIHIGRPIRIKNTFLEDLDDLIKVASKNGDEIKEYTAKMVSTYKPQRRKDDG
ncbi:polysaccharide biosynthesis protein [Candidatus Saccharibacteria bacterium]|nr:polysaccharide biosynthesis protein [Candidatus Saccharibacteria bacterium]